MAIREQIESNVEQFCELKTQIGEALQEMLSVVAGDPLECDAEELLKMNDALSKKVILLWSCQECIAELEYAGR